MGLEAKKVTISLDSPIQLDRRSHMILLQQPLVGRGLNFSGCMHFRAGAVVADASWLRSAAAYYYSQHTIVSVYMMIYIGGLASASENQPPLDCLL